MSKNKKKPELYNDLHPETSLKKTGFKNKKIAMETLKLVKNRSLKYQFDVINTMYNRAKYHPNKTTQMKEAMDVFHSWLKKYPIKKEKELRLFPFIPIDIIKKYEKLAKIYKTNDEFYKISNELNGKYYKLQYLPIKSNNPSGEDYWSYRINYIRHKLKIMKQLNIGLYYIKGKYNELPTRHHLDLIFHAYSPDKKHL